MTLFSWRVNKLANCEQEDLECKRKEEMGISLRFALPSRIRGDCEAFFTRLSVDVGRA